MSDGAWYIVPSESDPGTRYRVFISATDQEPCYCDCIAYSTSKGPWKSCKHIKKLIAERRLLSAPRTIEEEARARQEEG